jgi:hypothetical protein
VNGHLSAVQDPVLTGYASAITPEAARAGGSATLRALEGLTSVRLVTRSWFADLYGADRRMTAHEAVRRVLEAPINRLAVDPKAGFTSWQPESFSRNLGLPAERSWSCLADAFMGRADDEGTIRVVLQYAAESRARGVLQQWADFARRRPDASPPRLRALTGAPWDPAIAEVMLQEVRDAILVSAMTAAGESGDRMVGPFRAPQPTC